MAAAKRALAKNHPAKKRPLPKRKGGLEPSCCGKHDLCSCSPQAVSKGQAGSCASKQKVQRLTRSEMFVGILQVMKGRSTCTRSQVAALIVRENRIISMGYAGSPAGLPHCLDVGCEMSNGGCIRTIHAEANAIAFAARHGIATEGAEVWVSLSPCSSCSKLMINAGITTVYYLEKYRDEAGINLLLKAGIKVYHYTGTRIEHII